MRTAAAPARIAGCLVAAALSAPSGIATAAAPSRSPEPVLSQLSLTNPQIHAVGVDGTGLPKRTRLKLTLDVAAMVRVRVKDVDPYGISRAFNTDLPAGSSAITFSARVDGTKMPPGSYKVVVKAHNSFGSSDREVLRLKIVGD